MATNSTTPTSEPSSGQSSQLIGSTQTITDRDRKVAQEEIEAKWPRLGLAKYHHRTSKGAKLRFDNRPWLIPIYMDHADQIVVRKASQIGLSDWALCELFARARAGQTVMYILPTDKMVYDFTPRRIDKMIARVKLYRDNSRVGPKDSDSKKQKTLFNVECFIVGTNSEKNFFEKPVDVLIVDEVDLCDQDNLDFADDRTDASVDETGAAQKIWRKIGNPSVTGTGIDAEYMDSDKKIWMIPCGHCNERQPLDWFKNFVREVDGGLYKPADESHSLVVGGRDLNPLCRRCNKPLDRLAEGEWVAEYQTRMISGYSPSQLFGDPRRGTPMLSLWLRFCKAMKNQNKMQKFYNQKLGIPFSGSGVKFTQDLLASCAADYLMPNKASGTVAGVDVGAVLHVHISKRSARGVRRKVFIGTVRDWYELDKLCKRMGVQGGVVDHMPEKHAAEEWVAAHPNWYFCDYNLADTSKSPIEIDEQAQSIRTNRTGSLDESLECYSDGMVELPIDFASADEGEFVNMMTASTRVEKEDASGNIKYIWTKAEDHHQHADNYERIAADQVSGSIVTAC